MSSRMAGRSQSPVVRVSLLAAVAALAGVGLVAFRARYLPCGFEGECAEGRALPGLAIDGETVPAGADVRAFVQARADALLARKVSLTLGGDPARTVAEDVSLADLGVSVDVERVVARALSVGRDEDLVSQIETAMHARRGSIDVPLIPEVDASRVLARLEPVKEEEDQAPVSARLDLDHHGVLPEKPGQYVDLDGAVAALARAASDPAATSIAVPVSSFAPQVSGDALAKIDISRVMSAFDTGFGRGGEQSRRARNIEIAASRINGLVLMPGQAMSFNEIVGARSEENGFQKAGEIFKGEMVEGVGGGTCQVASTLHAIAFFGGLDVLERLPHSRPSAYIPLGLDATVVYPSVDLKLRNPFKFPVAVHAWVEGNRVKMELLGADKPVTVTFGKDVLATFPFTRKVVEEDSVTEPKIKQKGIKGVEIRRARVLTWVNGERKVETSVDTYPPTTEIYKVPPGFDADTLPPVGEDPNKKDDAKQGV